ncbi:MAG: MATE family efflux transporter, partial [Clostridia bacterium]|nr:MATE family efflux transporter [Clostridia bacterium]
SLILAFVVVVVVVVVGLLTIEPLFYGLGATDVEMPYIKQYMTVWYFGVPLVVIPMVGNNIIRALGDTKIPGLVMLVAAGMNIMLDPLFIFGIGFFPQMGVTGAALATVISRFTTLCVSLYVLGRRERLLTFAGFSFAKMRSSFARVLHVAIPSALTRAIVPFGAYIITGLLAVYGAGVVAGYGAGIRSEFVMLTVVGALASVMISYSGQNFGARNIERLRQGFKFAVSVNALYSIGAYAVLFFAAPYVAKLFSSEEIIMQTTVLYLRIAGAGLAFQGSIQIVTSSFNAVGKPIYATIIALLQMFGIYIPLSFALSSLLGQAGIFVALVISYILAAVIGHISFMRFLRKEEANIEVLEHENTKIGDIVK